MKRKLNRGIFFYPMEADHTGNKRIRLLFNDHDSDGYWIWSNLISYGYRLHGYYFLANMDDIELLAADCRKSPELIQEVILSCVKRGLFVKEIYNQYLVLTNDRMQINYLRATYENRRKGTVVYFSEKYFAINREDLVELSEKFLLNAVFKESGKSLQGYILEKPNSSEKHENSSEKHENSSEKHENSSEKHENSEHKRKGKERKGKKEIPMGAEADASAVVGIVGKNELSVGRRKKGDKKIKGRNPDSEPYWKEIRAAWVLFNRTHLKFNVNPMPKRDYSHMHRIIENIRERTTGEGELWTQDNALERWKNFLTVAYTKTDNWLHGNFLLNNIESKMQKIFNIIENPNGQQSGNKVGPNSSSTHGRTIEFDKP